MTYYQQMRRYSGTLRVVILFLIIVGAAVIIGLSRPEQIPTNQQVHGTSHQKREKGAAYLAMGDSYSAGGGADKIPKDPASDSSVYEHSVGECRRSKLAAQNIIANDLMLTLTDTTCSGAITSEILTESQKDMPPQLTKLSPSTALVTLTIGANDTALMYAVTCIQTSDCENDPAMTTLVQPRLEGLRINLVRIYQKIYKIAPNAKIRPAGYPYVIAPPGESTGTCNDWLTATEQQAFHDLLVGTNNTIKQTVADFAANNKVDIVYIDPLAPSSPFMQRDEGKLLDGCSKSEKRYMNGTLDGPSGLWHPNIYGQQHYAELYEKSL